MLGHQCLTAPVSGEELLVYEFPIRINEQGYFWSFCAGWCWAAVRWVLLVLCWGTGHEFCDGCELSGSGLSESGLRGGC